MATMGSVELLGTSLSITMASWVCPDNDSEFSIDVLPYGIFSTASLDARIGVAIGEYVLDVKVLSQEGIFSAIDFDASVLGENTLNAFAALGPKVHQQVRTRIQQLLATDTSYAGELRDHPRRGAALVKMSEARLHLPMNIGDYTDFFVGIHHARNCFDIVNPGAGLHANYLSQPVGYHGRSSSVVISKTPIRRPKGQFLVDGQRTFGPSQKLDIEVEFAAFISHGNELGRSVSVDDAENHIFGFVILNDWSARDIQAWESTPLGPFNAKNFGTTISPWVVPPAALESFREKPTLQGDNLLPYLRERKEASVYNIPIYASLRDQSGEYHMFECNTKHVVFSFAQLIAHHTAGGCPLRTGDLISTGTLSGPSHQELGCLFEASKDGREPYELLIKGSGKHGITRTYLVDGDSICFRARGFGSCEGQILPSE